MLEIELLEETADVYDLTIAENENFYANNILIHNCTEITLPTTPLENIFDESGRIALCTLSAINWGTVKSPQDFERPCELAVRGLDALLDYQKYPILAAELHSMEYRPLGIGIINLAYFLAKNDSNYSEPNLELIDEYAEAWSYYLIKASVDLAKEKGPCSKVEHTKYSDGILPIDTYKKEVDTLIPHKTRMPWDNLRVDLKEFGIRNSTLMALMPAECQSLNNELRLADGSIATLEEIIQDKGNIDIKKVHDDMMIGQRFAFLKPVELADSVAYECYYNGPQQVDELEFEDGSTYRFTPNHKLLVRRDGIEEYVQVSDLREGDDIIE